MDTQSLAAGIKESGLLRSQALIGGKWSDAYDGKTIKVSYSKPAFLLLIGVAS